MSRPLTEEERYLSTPADEHSAWTPVFTEGDVECIIAAREKAAYQEALTDALHPEFGTEWREPDGIIYKEVQEARAEHRREWADYFEGQVGTVGSEPLTVEKVIAALRFEVVPFGRAAAKDGTVVAGGDES